MDPKLESRLKKLMALADRGVGGEKQNAQRMLQKLLDKHGLTIAELLEDKTEWHSFRYRGKEEETILSQTFFKILDAQKIGVIATKSELKVRCTQFQAIEIQTHWDVYRTEYRKERKALLDAFIVRNSIYPATKPDQQQPSKPMSKADLDNAERAMGLARGMNKVQVHTRIGGGR